MKVKIISNIKENEEKRVEKRLKIKAKNAKKLKYVAKRLGRFQHNILNELIEEHLDELFEKWEKLC